MKKYRIGIEITEKNLQLAVVMKQKGGWHLLETTTLPFTATNPRQTLQQVRRNLNRSIRQVILGLPFSQVLMKEIHLDSTLSNDEIYQYLQQQAPTLFGKPADHWILDFEVQPTGVRAVAAPREYIVAQQEIFRSAGFQIQAVDVDVLAFARLARTLENYRPDQLQALLWLKTTELVFIVMSSGQLIYAKSTAYSSTQQIMQVLTPLLQFFNGLYPQHTLTQILLLNENEALPNQEAILKNATLNPDIWDISGVIQPHEFCSLGLAIYDY